ncbi:MAG: hypothetical protein ABSE08_15495 [Syntrophobacteraceae bacterium]|jgi:hypothetical protein
MGDTSVNTNIADAGPAGWIAYSTAAIMAWAFLCGFVSGKALLFMSCISLGCTVAYMGATISQLKLGNVAGGVTWLYFGAFFGFASALNYAVSYFAPIYHWELDPKILGFEWAVIGIVLILSTPIFFRYAPASGAISVLGADVALASLSLIYFGYNGAFMMQLSGWAFFVAGVLGIVMAAGGILASAGMAFPVGKPLFKHES